MEYTLNFTTRDRMKKALEILDRNPKFTCTCYGRDYGTYNYFIPSSPMYYVSFTIH